MFWYKTIGISDAIALHEWNRSLLQDRKIVFIDQGTGYQWKVVHAKP